MTPVVPGRHPTRAAIVMLAFAIVVSACVTKQPPFSSHSRAEEQVRRPRHGLAPRLREGGSADATISDAGSSLRAVEEHEAKRLRFPWTPPHAPKESYAGAGDHELILLPGLVTGREYPLLIAFHGTPKAGQEPQSYAFPRNVAELAIELVASHQVVPFLLAIPAFRFKGANWPGFDVAAFERALTPMFEQEGIGISDVFVVGHSGAVGCGGQGMNQVHRIRPKAVGLFDTCLGPGWAAEVLDQRRAGVPTVIIQSVETAGIVPRQPKEYSSTFDFGAVFSAIGLVPVNCPEMVPSVPLRTTPFRCSADSRGITQAFVVDTGEGETAHDAVVSVGLEYFLRRFLGASP